MLDGVFDDDEFKFKNLTLTQFLYGELCIWEKPKLKKDELKARLYLMKKVLKNEPKLGFDKAKEIYKIFLTRVEKELVNWKKLAYIDRIETEVINASTYRKGQIKLLKWIARKDWIPFGAKISIKGHVHCLTIMRFCSKAEW